MKSILWLGTCVVSFAAVGCQTSSSEKESAKSADAAGTRAASGGTTQMTKREDRPAPRRQILGLEEGWELVPSATYTASQTPAEVIIKAMGEHPTAGYETKLVMSPLRIYPPQWVLAQKKPDGPVPQVITPFEATASFNARDPVKEVQITDRAGKHAVPVDQARD
jgi:hypothetical protein